MAEAHLAGAKSVAAALNTFTFVLSVGGGVILLAILWEAAAWRRLVWHVVKDAGVVESSVPSHARLPSFTLQERPLPPTFPGSPWGGERDDEATCPASEERAQNLSAMTRHNATYCLEQMLHYFRTTWEAAPSCS